MMRYILIEMYEKQGRDYAGFHAGYILDQVESIAAYEGAPPQLTVDFLRRAWRNLFTSA